MGGGWRAGAGFLSAIGWGEAGSRRGRGGIPAVEGAGWESRRGRIIVHPDNFTSPNSVA